MTNDPRNQLGEPGGVSPRTIHETVHVRGLTPPGSLTQAQETHHVSTLADP